MSAADIPLWPDNPTAEDLLGFEDVANPIVDALKRDRLDPVALGIFGDWGSGKTTVLEIVQDQLKGDGSIVVVYTQPWEYDPATDPKATLIGEVLERVRRAAEDASDGGLGPDLKKKFKKLAKRVRWSKAIGLAARSAVSLSPPSFEQVTEIFGTEEGETVEPTLQGFRQEFETLMKELKTITRVVVLVDDLDRCLPDSVVGTLEAIKLFLSVPKMGFVIAADQRLVRHAIATRYEGSGQAEEMAQEYLEKIVQIPLRVPSLGEGDTEAYLALLLLHRHFADSEDEFKKIVEYLAKKRAQSAPRVLDGLASDAVPEAAQEEYSLAAQLAPILAGRVNGNPRRLKRFLNAYWLRSDIAQRRKAKLEPAALAKLLVLEELDPEQFRILLGWLSDGTLAEHLKNLEEAKKKDGLADDEQQLFGWAQEGPKLAEKDLGPYLRLAASLRSVPGPRTELSSELVELLDGLSSDARATRKEAQGKTKGRLPDERLSLARELVRRARAEPGRQGDIGESLAVLAEEQQVAEEIAARLRDVDPGTVDPSLIVYLGDVAAVHPVLTKWLEGDRLSADAKRAAKQALEAN